jgi:hypothetical protein
VEGELEMISLQETHLYLGGRRESLLEEDVIPIEQKALYSVIYLPIEKRHSF